MKIYNRDLKNIKQQQLALEKEFFLNNDSQLVKKDRLKRNFKSMRNIKNHTEAYINELYYSKIIPLKANLNETVSQNWKQQNKKILQIVLHGRPDIPDSPVPLHKDKETDFDFCISNWCNAGCPACRRYINFCIPNEESKLHPGLNQIHMDFEVYKKIIQENIKQFENSDVTFEGELGDPLVHPKVRDFVFYSSPIFNTLRIVTNGGVRTNKFFEEIGNNLQNVQITFSIDGLTDETNQQYRVRVNTKKAIKNMVTFKNTWFGKTNAFWKFIIFEHNWFEIPRAMDLATYYDIPISFIINSRDKFLIPDSLIPTIIKSFNDNSSKKKHQRIGRPHLNAKHLHELLLGN